MSRYRIFFPLFFVFVSAVAHAQGECSGIVRTALDSINDLCAATSRNQLCYGNNLLNATPRESVDDFHFEEEGDRVSVNDVETLQLSALSLTDELWGVALMRVQANLPNTLPGQNVSFVLFGDVSIVNQGETPATLRMTTSESANIRQRPNTDARVMESVGAGDNVTANGRLADNSWIRVQLRNASGSAGWVWGGLFSTAQDLNRLAVADPGAPIYGPMQAFTLYTGIGDIACSEVPESGALIQTPAGRGLVKLVINDVQISLGSTVYLQAQPGDALTVTVIEGQADVTSANQSQTVPAGTFSEVPLDANGLASGAPSYPQPYDLESLTNLPLATLPLEVELADPPDQIADAVTEAEQTIAILPVASQVENASTTYQGCDMTPVAGPVNIYAAPSRGAQVLDQLNPGAALYLEEKTTIGWYHTTWFPQGNVEAWVAVEDVRLTGPCDSVPIRNP